MTLLKSLIQRLLDSRTTPAQASNASKPVSGTPVEYNPSPSIGNWGQVLTNSIAVSDGYIWAAGRTSAIGGFLQVNSQALQITASGTSIGEGETLNIFIPVSKGQGFTVYARSMNQIVVRLVRTIGGGYNILLRRALSCLRPSFNFSQRSSFRTNPSGSEANPSRTQLQLGSPFNTLFLINTRLQKTGTSVLEEMLTRSTLVCAVHCLVLLLIQKGFYKDLSPLKKVYLSGFTARQQINNHFTLNSFLCKAANFRTGGALC